MQRKIRFRTLIGVIAALCLLAAVINFPRHIRGHWVRRRIEWYGWGPGVPIVLYPGVVDYVYRSSSGQLVQHGPYHRYVMQSFGDLRVAEEGFFDNGARDGTFREWNTNDETKGAETFYVHGKQIGDAWYQHGKLFQYREDLYDGNKRIATKMFANGKWFLDKVSACLNFTIDPRTGQFRYLSEVKCQ
jgi:hypothetical protein